MRKALSRRGYQIVAIQTSKRNQKLNTADDKNNMTDLAKNHYGHLLSVTFVTENSIKELQTRKT